MGTGLAHLERLQHLAERLPRVEQPVRLAELLHNLLRLVTTTFGV